MYAMRSRMVRIYIKLIYNGARQEGIRMEQATRELVGGKYQESKRMEIQRAFVRRWMENHSP